MLIMSIAVYCKNELISQKINEKNDTAITNVHIVSSICRNSLIFITIITIGNLLLPLDVFSYIKECARRNISNGITVYFTSYSNGTVYGFSYIKECTRKNISNGITVYFTSYSNSTVHVHDSSIYLTCLTFYALPRTRMMIKILVSINKNWENILSRLYLTHDFLTAVVLNTISHIMIFNSK